MILKIRKIAGVLSIFILMFLLTYLALNFVILINDIDFGPVLISYGDLPTGDKFSISSVGKIVFSICFAVSLFSALLFSVLLRKLTKKKASAVSMLPVILLAVVLAVLSYLSIS